MNKYLLPFLLFMQINDEENQSGGGCSTIVIVVAVLLLAMSICSSIIK
jgi:hypothetical protein